MFMKIFQSDKRCRKDIKTPTARTQTHTHITTDTERTLDELDGLTVQSSRLASFTCTSSVGVNAAANTSPTIFGRPGTKYIPSPAQFVKFLLSHAKRHDIFTVMAVKVNVVGGMNAVR